MKKLISQPLLVILTVSLFVLQGCASSNTQFTKKDMQSSEPVKVVRYETPGIMKSTGTETAFLALVTLAAPGGTALLVVGDQYAKARGSDTQTRIPDFGSLVMNKFAERMPIARPDWPELTLVREPLKEDYSEKSTVIELRVNRLAYGSLDLTRGGIALERGLDKGIVCDGFLSKTAVTMKDAGGEILWEKSFVYLSEDFARAKGVDELEADNFKLLREEMEFAADKTVADFIEHLNGEKTGEKDKQNFNKKD
jgi:hypothetical protein